MTGWSHEGACDRIIRLSSPGLMPRRAERGRRMSLDAVRAVADAVLYEGYLLYPYRASSRKNQSRWQFGVLGPPGAAERGLGEESSMATQCLLGAGVSTV